MKLLTDIINNMLVSEEVDIRALPADKTFYVEVYLYSRSSEPKKELFACLDFEIFSNKLFCYNQRTGYYFCVINNSTKYYSEPVSEFRSGAFPYIRVGKNYSSFNALDEFKESADNYLVINPQLVGKSLKYTFGLEFETSQGFIPEHICYQNGLIPLHDGSISGIEYTTTVLQKHSGLSLLTKQVNLLKSITTFNKDCALHIHFGGFPVNIKAVYTLYLLCVSLEKDLRKHNCPAVFQTDLYKNSGKNYCNSYNKRMNFEEFCYIMSAGHTTNITNLTQTHPSDNSGDRKWNINIRYFWVNFINILFFNRAKTVEFRFLRPTYNINKIIGWIYLFNAILLYAEQLSIKLEKDFAKSKLKKAKLVTNTPISESWQEFYYKNITSTTTLSIIINSVYENTLLLTKLQEFLQNLQNQATLELNSKDIYGAEEIKTDYKYFTTNIAHYDE